MSEPISLAALRAADAPAPGVDDLTLDRLESWANLGAGRGIDAGLYVRKVLAELRALRAQVAALRGALRRTDSELRGYVKDYPTFWLAGHVKEVLGENA